MSGGWQVYILRCADGTLYTGMTNDVEKRLQAHNSGRGVKYTRSRLPVELAYKEACPGRREALSREAALKRLTRAEKLEPKRLRLVRHAPQAPPWLALVEARKRAGVALSVEPDLIMEGRTVHY